MSAPAPASPEVLSSPADLARREHRLWLKLMIYRGVVLSVALLFAWEASLGQVLFTLLALAVALGVGQLIHRSQLAWLRRRWRQEELRRQKAEQLAREAAAREAEQARQASYFDWDEGEQDGAGQDASGRAGPTAPAGRAGP